MTGWTYGADSVRFGDVRAEAADFEAAQRVLSAMIERHAGSDAAGALCVPGGRCVAGCACDLQRAARKVRLFNTYSTAATVAVAPGEVYWMQRTGERWRTLAGHTVHYGDDADQSRPLCGVVPGVGAEPTREPRTCFDCIDLG